MEIERLDVRKARTQTRNEIHSVLAVVAILEGSGEVTSCLASKVAWHGDHRNSTTRYDPGKLVKRLLVARKVLEDVVTDDEIVAPVRERQFVQVDMRVGDVFEKQIRGFVPKARDLETVPQDRFGCEVQSSRGMMLLDKLGKQYRESAMATARIATGTCRVPGDL